MQIKLYVVLSLLLLTFATHAEPTAGQDINSSQEIESVNPDWLAGTGADLKIKIKGSILNEAGAPINDATVLAIWNSRNVNEKLNATVQDNQFEVWVPVGRQKHFRVLLAFKSADEKQIADLLLGPYQLRKMAIEGRDIVLQTSDRRVSVTVVSDGKLVADAYVRASFSGQPDLTQKTNTEGVTDFDVMSDTELQSVTAWKKSDTRGESKTNKPLYQTGRIFRFPPPSGGFANGYTIEIQKCVDQRVKYVNAEDGSPIPYLNVDLGGPGRQANDSPIQTNQDGIAVNHWFLGEQKVWPSVLDPNWFAEVNSSEPNSDGIVEFQLKRSQFKKRKLVKGFVKSPSGESVAGICLQIQTLQAEQKFQTETFFAFTDRDGKFQASYLPDSTYTISVNDAQLVSKPVDLIPFDSKLKITNQPKLELTQGALVEIVVTEGAMRFPVKNQGINLKTQHSFSWREKDKTRHGTAGRSQWLTTDEHGKAYALAVPGEKIEAVAINSGSISKKQATVAANGVTKIEIHRQATLHSVIGQLIAPDDMEVDFTNAQIEIGSVDGQTQERLSIKADKQGAFSFETKSLKFGVFACTANEKAAAIEIFDHDTSTINLKLKPTGELHGRLLGENNKPLVGHLLKTSVTVADDQYSDSSFVKAFTAKTITVKTDENGDYVISGVPTENSFHAQAKSLDGASNYRNLEEFYLVPGERRPITVSNLWTDPNPAVIPLETRFKNRLRDCSLSNYNAMILLYENDKPTSTFVDNHLLDYDRTKEVTTFMQLAVLSNDDKLLPKDLKFMKSQNWGSPKAGTVTAVAIDGTGKEIGRIDLDVTKESSQQEAAKFISDHAPDAQDASKKWDEAFALAKKTDRKVWLRVCQRYCGPCYRLTRWVDDQKQLLEKDYVMIKIDDFHDVDGFKVANRLRKNRSVPFHGIFDANEELLIDSEGPHGNIGFPSSFDGLKHLKKMLDDTKVRLTDTEVQTLIESLR